MVQPHRGLKMTSEQPLKKKLRRGNDQNDPTDEPDFIHTINESPTTDLSSLHLALPLTVNEDDVVLKNTFNTQLHSEKPVFRTSCDEREKDDTDEIVNSDIENISIKPAPDIITSNYPHPFINSYYYNKSCDLEQNEIGQDDGIDDFQQHLIKQCLCTVSEESLRRPFEGQKINDSTGPRTAMLSEWSSEKVLQFLSNLQLLFDVYLKQDNKGFICPRIVNICDTIIRNEYNLIEQIISLCELRNKYINYLAARVLSSFLIIAKTDINNEWLETIVNFLTVENIDYVKMNFALEIVKRVVEWKDVEIHVLEDSNDDSASTSSSISSNCKLMPCDPENFDTSGIKNLVIKSLESKWPDLIQRIQNLILTNTSMQAQTCILTFLTLWESTISVKANLSITDTKPFYAHLEIFVVMLTSNLPAIIWKQLLSLFNEVLCYGSTLALQDMLPDDAANWPI